ncbi:MAG: hypothetical protein IH605_21425 [Burkholderiales bacterium]|nr:hypothetical protein [Burkholderiales bacterium]
MPNDATPRLLLDNGESAIGANITATQAGMALSLALPAGRKLERAVLAIGAASDAEIATKPTVSSDAGALTGTADARWVSVDWGTELAVVAVKIDGAGPEKLRTGMRVKLYSNGNWMPLPPLDTLMLGAEQRFPAVAASRLIAEMLVENVVDEKNTGVLIPGSIKARAASMRATAQPCHVALAVGDDPPFFTYPGPLPLAPASVTGLARVANRYLADHPRATHIPMRLIAAADADVKVASFEAALVPLPGERESGAAADARASLPVGSEESGSGSAAGARTPLPVRSEELYLTPATPETVEAARLCDAQHSPAQCFEPLPSGKLLSRLELYLRATTTKPVQGEVSVHLDWGGVPAPEPLARAPLEQAAPAAAGWVSLPLPQTLALSAGKWWLVCSVTAGELAWYVTAPTPATGPTLSRVGQGPWMPVNMPAPGSSAQVQLWVTAAAAA